MKKCRHLIFVLGDQLNLDSAALADIMPDRDAVLMAEVREESTHVWSAKPRTAFFFSAMRHFAESLRAQQLTVDYRAIGKGGKHGDPNFASLVDVLADAINQYKPEKIVMVEPGDWRIERQLTAFANSHKINLVMREDRHFMCSRAEFAEWAKGYKQLRLEYFYRTMRRRFSIMMDGNEPLQGRWNFDAANRGAFPKSGPGGVPPTLRVPPDDITASVIVDVQKHFADHPGSLEEFAWPVTREDALRALRGFVAERLAAFGQYQDAMWTNEPFLYHSHISAALNVKLLDPREVIVAAVAAFDDGRVPIEAVEGFVRQVLGWREFIRGVYWLDMPGMREANFFNHDRKLPKWYWTGNTQMNCMRDTIGQTLKYGYAHHIQRLMVTGIFGLMAEVAPTEIED